MGYVTKLLANDAVKNYIARHQPEILSQLKLVVITVSRKNAFWHKTRVQRMPPRSQ